MSYKMRYRDWLKAKHWLLFAILDKTRTTKIMVSCVNRTGYAEDCICDYLNYRDLKTMILVQGKTIDVWCSYLGF